MVVKPKSFVDSAEVNENPILFESYEDFLKKLKLENGQPGHYLYRSTDVDMPPQFDINIVNQWTQVITDMALVQLVSLCQPYKWIVNCIIIEKSSNPAFQLPWSQS